MISCFFCFFLVHPEEKYMSIKNHFDFFISDKNYNQNLSRQLEIGKALRESADESAVFYNFMRNFFFVLIEYMFKYT